MHRYALRTITFWKRSLKKYDGIPMQLGCIKDDKENIKREVAKAFEQSDIVVTTGGVSVGDFDFVKDVISRTWL